VRWRDDYAAESLGELMNRLADDPAGVLVGHDFASTTGLRLGDRLVVQLSDLGAAVDVPMVVVGFVDMFPTAYPGDGPLLIGNLDYAVEQQGGQYPYEVWLRVDEGVTRADIRRGEIELGLNTITKDFAPQILAAERGRPERQGLFGLLSVGFIGAATLTAIGFLIYAALSFQRRFVELGTMRAIGLSSPQLGTLLAAEQALVLAGGMVAGTLVGVTASMLFIPFMHVRDDPRAQIPPFHVEIAWEQIWLIYLVFGILLVAGVAVMLALLRRFQLFQAVKLGETV
jgi:putative ABC transport system permease protein